ncbi:hypothetical protein C8A01DRAFT_32922 [Parachaetomium inaequale]|uniref:Uncharacterized protein n=1 Tax=Parachaetomium inaequale TaxID=2588326 RepID=A0AAN6PL14_9PEZI|nr:hypothetical protein C8A01DRAFT_32922 [Parachaetomium inaequale]
MQFTVATVLAFAAMAFAYPAVDSNSIVVKRQSNVEAQLPSMSDGTGNVIPFDATKVKGGN